MDTRVVIAVPGRPGVNSLLWWFQGPSDNIDDYHFSLNGQPVNLANCRIVPLASFFVGVPPPLATRTFLLATPAHHATPYYKLTVTCSGNPSNVARSRPLPQTLENSTGKLHAVLASCFHTQRSRISGTTPLPKQFLEPQAPPHLKILCGDQIYLDLSAGGALPIQPGSFTPAQHYFEQWRTSDFLGWLSNGANIFLADDHEFWNNYPSTKRLGWLSQLFATPSDRIAQEMLDCFLLYQAALNCDPDALLANPAVLPTRDDLHCFELPGTGAPPALRHHFNLLALDTRIARIMPVEHQHAGQFCHPAWLTRATQWIAQLQGPGLLLTSQPLLDKQGGSEANLADFEADFAALWRAIMASPHQILLMSGDIHWSRAHVVERKGGDHYEVVSSAIARILPFDFTVRFKHNNDRITWQGGGGVNITRTALSNQDRLFAILELSGESGGLTCTTRWWQHTENRDLELVDIYPGLGTVLHRKTKVSMTLR